MSPDQTIAHYRITAKLGEGGMGEVWRATDTKLNRDVALKILAEAFANDRDRMARFEREAQVLASLNHPNIAAIYGVEERAIVMELVEGPTLADRIGEGPIPLDEALAIARQIADALEAAHEKNVVHRDLKPANVKVTPDGRVKVLDFGLAKAMTEEVPGGKPSISPTLTMGATLAGVILGTAAYMSPEQARGRSVDKRADIWAFGVVLYEMLTGRTLFESETISDSLAAVLTREPELERVPVKVRRLLRRCLEKDPKKRLRDIGDAWGMIEDVPAPAPAKQSTLPWMIAGAAALAAIAFAFAWQAARHVEPELKPLVRLEVDLGPDVSVGQGLAISPDGTMLVYVSQQRLYVRRLDQEEPAELAGTEGAFNPFFSPDGKWIAFFGNGQLRKISVDGGSPIKLADTSNNPGLTGSWGEDGNILANFSPFGNPTRISSDGGKPEAIPEPQGQSHRWPQIAPGGKVALFSGGSSTSGNREFREISAFSIRSGQWKRIVSGQFGRYLPSGHLVYLEQGTLYAAAFDLDRLEIRGAPVQVWKGIIPLPGAALLDFSRNGTMVYRSGEGAGQNSVQWVDEAGKTETTLLKPGRYTRPRLSPDGGRLAVTVGVGPRVDILTYEFANGRERSLTFDGNYLGPIWTHDGRYIIATRPDGGMYWIRSDGGNTPRPLLPGQQNRQLPSSINDRLRRLAFTEQYDNAPKYHLWTVPFEFDAGGVRAGKPEPFFHTTDKDERHPMFSPDGHWMAYSSDELGKTQIFVRAFEGSSLSARWQISKEGGLIPAWSRDGSQLFFRTEDNQVMVAGSCRGTQDSFGCDNPRVWTETRLAYSGPSANYDVDGDGKRIIAILPESEVEQKLSHQVILVLNFFDELRRRVPTGK